MCKYSNPSAHCVRHQNKILRNLASDARSYSLLNCSASGVDDAVGEVCMTVEISSDPNTGGHKITVKGACVFQTCSVSPVCQCQGRVNAAVVLGLIDSCGSQ